MNGELLAKKIMETVSGVQKVYFTTNSVAKEILDKVEV